MKTETVIEMSEAIKDVDSAMDKLREENLHLKQEILKVANMNIHLKRRIAQLEGRQG